MNVVDFAYQVIEMRERICQLEAENAELRQYKQKYHEEVDASLRHGEQMMVGWLDLILSDKIKLQPAQGESA